MRLISLLNHYQRFPGFVYEKARLCALSQTIEITVRPRRGSRPVCSGCHKPAPTYDHLNLRRFEFVPLSGCMMVFLYCMRRVDCRAAGYASNGPVGCRQTPADQGLHAVPGALGEEAILAGDRRVVSQHLG